MEVRGEGDLTNKLLKQGKKLIKSTDIVVEVEADSSSVSKSGNEENEETEENEVNSTQERHNRKLQNAQFDNDSIECTAAVKTRVSSSKVKSMKRRGPSRGVQPSGEPMTLEFDESYNPIGKWAHRYGRHIGTCAYRVDINVGSYFDLDVMEKNKNWEETKRLFNIQNPDLKKKEKKFHSQVAARFRNWKSKLRRRWLMKTEATCDEQSKHEESNEQSSDAELEEGESGGRKSKKQKRNEDEDPWVVYDGIISKDQWKKFEQTYYSKIFQSKSKKARASGKKNEHPHRMGQNSYYIAIQKWIKEGRLSPPPATESCNSTVDGPSIAFRASRRSEVWKLAHEKKLSDGSWGVDPSAVKTKEIVQKIDQQLEVEAKSKAEGTFVQDRGMDALSKAIGKRDHRGRVRAIGGINVGIEEVFGRGNRKGKKLKTDNSESTEELTNRLMEEVQSRFENEFKEIVDKAVDKVMEEVAKNRIGDVCKTKNSAHLLDTPRGSVSKVIQAPKISEVKKPCYLAVMDTDTDYLVVVADGTAYEYNSTNPVIRNEQVKVDHYKVSLDNPYPEHMDVELPCVSKDGKITKVGQAKGHFVEWPVDQVVFVDEEEEPFRQTMQPRHDVQLGVGKKTLDDVLLRVGNETFSSEEIQSPKSMVGSASSQIKTFDDPAIDDNLTGEECQSLILLLSSANEFNPLMITIAPPLFYYTAEEHSSAITIKDIEKFLKGNCINILILQVYQLFLLEEYADFFERSLVSLLCPAKLSADIAKTQPSKYRHYLRDVFMLEKNKGDKQCKFLLAPYNEGTHWMLFVIELQAGEVYVFNSTRNDKLWNLKIYPFLNLAFQIYIANGGKCTRSNSKELRYVTMECAQQSDGVECGYYTMKFMHEIVSMYSDCSSLKEDYFGTCSSYTTQELNIIREQWVKFFRNRYITP